MNPIRYEVRLLYDDDSCPHSIKREALIATFLDRDAAVAFAQSNNRSSQSNRYIVIRILEERVFDDEGREW